MTDERVCVYCGKPVTYRGHMQDYAYKTRIQGKTYYFCSHTCQAQAENWTKVDIDPMPLIRARKTYGNTNQIAVCIEELSELIKVLAKYFRYDPDTAVQKLRQDALDETTDVYIILEHVKGIFNLRNAEVNSHAEAKIARLNRWLNTSNDFSYTMEDRDV